MNELDKVRIGGKLVKVYSYGKSEPNDESYLDAAFRDIIECPNCGQQTEYGSTRMISGFVGCDNVIPYSHGKRCYFDDLMPRVIKTREEDYNAYVDGKGIYLTDIQKKEI